MKADWEWTYSCLHDLKSSKEETCNDYKQNNEDKEIVKNGRRVNIFVLAVCSWETLSARASSVPTDSSVLALSSTLFNLVAQDRDVSTHVNLSKLSSPFPLNSTWITGEVGWKQELLSVKAGFFSSARKGSFLVWTLVEREKDFECIFVSSWTNPYDAGTNRWWMYYLPGNEVSRVRSSNEMHRSSLSSPTWLLRQQTVITYLSHHWCQ